MCLLSYIYLHTAPGPPRQVTIKPVNSTAIKLFWKPPVGDFVKDYLLVQESSGKNVSVTDLLPEMDMHIVKVMPGSAYNFSLYARINISGAPFISVLETFSMLHCTIKSHFLVYKVQFICILLMTRK